MNTKRVTAVGLGIMLAGACNKISNINSEGLLLSRTKWDLTDVKSTPSIPKTATGSSTVYFSDVLDYYGGSPNACYFSQSLSFTNILDPDLMHGNYTLRQGTAACTVRPDTTRAGEWTVDLNTGSQQLYLWADRDNGLLNTLYTITQVTYDTLILTQKTQISGVTGTFNFSYIFTPAGSN
jgi:hypothetical protein